MAEEKPIISVCGKGGVGKTAFCAMLGRALLDLEVKPLLLIDADPAGGLVSATGQTVKTTLAGAREAMIRAARSGDPKQKESLARDLDYLVMEALLERDGYALLAMGRMDEKGCFCPANTLLREAIDLLVTPFSFVLIDAEAGLEQISRQVTRRVTKVIAVSDGSSRSRDTINIILQMVGPEKLAVAVNRAPDAQGLDLPENVEILGLIPEDGEVRDFDRRGRPLWELPPDNPALEAARKIALKLAP
ncbi:MAG: AAA family ATPase [Deltaproteobacteria bacterium]|nr:AAA family ATPase [Deltaproteobacteria bacterium]